MSLHPPFRTPTDETRLMVLHTVKALPHCSNLIMQQFLFEYNEMNYFDMMIALNELCANGQVIRERKGEEHLYHITPAGEEALSLFGNRVPGSLIRFAKENAAVYRQKLMENEQYPCQVRKTESGEYVVTLSIREKDAPIMQFTLSLPTREMAANVMANWPRNAGTFYFNAIRTLSEEKE